MTKGAGKSNGNMDIIINELRRIDYTLENLDINDSRFGSKRWQLERERERLLDELAELYHAPITNSGIVDDELDELLGDLDELVADDQPPESVCIESVELSPAIKQIQARQAAKSSNKSIETKALKTNAALVCDLQPQKTADDSGIEVKVNSDDEGIDIDNLLGDLDELDNAPAEVIEGVIKQIADDQPAAQSSERPKHEVNELSSRVGEIYDLFREDAYSDRLDQELWTIIVELVDRGLTPARIFSQRKPKGEVGAYHRRLQKADLYYVWRWHRGRKAFNGFRGIFEGETFDIKLAEKIAAKELPMWGKKGKNGKIDADALSLHDCEDIQECLAVLISDKVRQRQDDERIKSDRLHNQNLEVKAHLIAYKQANNSRMDIPTHLAVWSALQQAGGDKSKLEFMRNAYKHATGKSIDKSTLRDKLKQLEKSLSWRRV